MDQNLVPPVLERIDAARKQLRLAIAQMPEAAIGQRPPSGKWSVLEHVRHLLFAEQAHMARIFREPPTWSPLGFTPETMRAARKLPPVDADGPALAAVWAEWNRIHRRTVRRLKALPPEYTEAALTRHLGHLRAHVPIIEKLARQASKS